MRSAIVLMLALLLCTPPAFAGVISYLPVTNDADSGISYTKVYTHAIDLGTGDGALVNLVPFTRVFSGNVDAIPNFGYTVTSAGRNDFGYEGSHNVSGDVADLFGDFMYNGNNAAGGVATLALSGLTVGTTYDTRIYTRAWGYSPNRVSQIAFENDGLAGADDSVTLNQDDASAVPPGLDTSNRAYAVSYQFTAQTDELSISFTQQNLNYSWHQYGVSNEVVGAQSGRSPIPAGVFFNTGVGDDGLVLAPGTPDPHYELVGVGPATVGLNHVAYKANDPVGTEGSSWIGPVADLHQNVPPGDYSYLTTFDLAGLDPDSVQLFLKVAVDNEMRDVLLNGVSTGISASGFAALSGPFVISSGFLPGLNTLEFLTANLGTDDNPHGFRAELSGVVPEPSTFILAAIALLGLYGWRRYRAA